MVRKYKQPKFTVTGLELVRGDWSQIAKELQKKVALAILNEEPEHRVARIVDGYKNKVFNNELKLKDIVISQRIRDSVESYKKPILDKEGNIKKKKDGTPYKKTPPEHVRVAEKIQEKGTEIVPGMIIEYVYQKEGTVPVNEYNGKYDAVTYWNKKIVPPTIRVLTSVFSKTKWEQEYIISKKNMKNKKLGDFF